MKIWNPYNIYFFRHLLHHKLYFIRMFHEELAYDYYEEVRHKSEDYAKKNYTLMEVEPPFIPIKINNPQRHSVFFAFLKEKYFKRITDKNPDIAYWIGNFGWFEIDTINPNKWLNDFYDFQKQRYQTIPQ